MASPGTETVARLGLSRPVFVRVLPFVVYVVLLALQSAFDQNAAIQASGFDTRWLYALRVAAVAGVLAYYWRDYTELSFTRASDLGRNNHVVGRLAAALAGALVFVLWINLDQGWVTLGASGPGFVALTRDGLPDWPLIVVRIFGAAVIVPVMEELFWRSFVQRWIDQPDFVGADPGRGSHRAILLASLFFGFEHNQWLAGVLAGLTYGYLYKYTGRLWVPVIAHAVTNFMLGWWVVARGQWHFW